MVLVPIPSELFITFYTQTVIRSAPSAVTAAKILCSLAKDYSKLLAPFTSRIEEILQYSLSLGTGERFKIIFLF